MIMKKIFLSFAALAALVSCAQENIREVELTRKVSVMANAAETKTLLDGNAVVWENGDAVALCFESETEGVSTTVFTTSETTLSSSAEFVGSLPNSVSVANGYAETGHAVYPSTAVGAGGEVEFTLPAEVEVNENGSFDSGMNLSSALVSLAELDADGSTDAAFRNAFSIVRFTLPAGVTDLDITADGNIAGRAGMRFDEDGRLVAEEWMTPSKTLAVTPAGVTFTAGTTYNVLVYPGMYHSLSVVLTDINGCTYEKTITGDFEFKPSNYYTFNFNTKFEKGYTFVGTGRSFASSDMVMTVYSVDNTVLHEEELQAAVSDGLARFTGNLPAALVEAADRATGFAVYPSTAYNVATDKITYTLPATVTSSTVLPELYSAYIHVGIEEAAFKSVEQSLSKLVFDLPAGISQVRIESTTDFIGTAEMTVGADGKLVPGSGDGDTVTLNSGGAAGTYTVYVYSLAGADLTVTYVDMAGEEVATPVDPGVGPGDEPGGSIEIPVPELKFDKDGTFSNESFTNGGNYDF